MVIQGITNKKILINKSTLVSCNLVNNHHKVCKVCNIDKEFHGLLRSDFLEHHGCFNNRQLVTKFKSLPTFKVTDESITKRTDNSIDPRTEQIYKLTCSLKNTEAILLATEIEKVHLPNAIVKIIEKGEFLANAIPKTIHFENITLKPVHNYQ